MTDFLLRRFVKNHKDVENLVVRGSYGRLAGIVGIVSNFVLFIIKLSAGLLSGSIAIVADAVNNLSDSASSVVTLVGFRLSAKPADAEHPYGHARIEYLSGLIVSFAILVLGLQLLQTSIGKIITPQPTEVTLPVIIVLVVSILGKLWQGAFYSKMGRAIRSEALAATSADSRTDVISTCAVLVGLVITYFTSFNLDGYLGILVAVFILITGVRLIIETSNPLLGMAPTKELVDAIYKKVLAYDGVLGLHDLTVHNYGPGRCFASLHCEVPAGQDILLSHDIIDNIERDFLTDMGLHLVIHLDPIVVNDERTNALKQQVAELLLGISKEISMHDFRVVWGNTHVNLIFDICVPFGGKQTDAQWVQSVAVGIKSIDSTYNAVVTVDHSYIPQ